MGGFNCQLHFSIWFTIKQYTEKPQRRTDCATGIPFGHHASKAHWLAMICVLSPQKHNLSKQSVILSEHSESKDLLMLVTASGQITGKILRLRASRSAQDDTVFFVSQRTI